MATTSSALPQPTLGQLVSSEDPKIVNLLSALVVDATTAEFALSTYKVLRERGAPDLGGAAPPSGTYVLGEDLAGVVPVSASAVFYLDPADFAASGRSSMLRIRALVVVNATAPATNWTFGLYGVATWGGAASAIPTVATLNAVVPGSTVAINTPNGATGTVLSGADFAIPAAGAYVLAVVNSGAAAANSRLAAKAVLQLRQV